MNFFNWLINNFLANFWDNLRIALDHIAAPFTDPRGTLKKLRGARPAFKTALLLLALVIVVVALGALTHWLGLARYMSKGHPFFRETWMGWLALIVIVIIRLAIAVLRQIRVLSPTLQMYTDIDMAIERGVQAAADAGIAIDQVPVFLVVGLSGTAEREFRLSESVGKEVCFDDETAPVHWYGNADALWVTLPGVSVTSAQADLLVEAQARAADKDSPYALVANQVAMPHTSAGGAAQAVSGEITSGGVAHAGSALTGTDDLDLATVSVKQRNEARDRLNYLCEALKTVRDPICTVNAVLLCVPFNEYVVAESVAQGFRESVRIDMTALQQSLGVRCLSAVVFSGCHDNPALRTYIERLPPNSVAHRCGISFPQLIELADDDSARMHEWLQRDFELQAMHLFKLAPGEPSNEYLFRFVDLVRTAQPYFSGILESAFIQGVKHPFYFSGAYLAELSSVGEVPQPFFAGVLVKVLREHDELICWSPQALHDDAKERNVSRVLLVLAILIMFYNTWLFWRIMTT